MSLPEKVRLVTLKWIDVIRYAAILILFVLVYFLLLKPVMKVITTVVAGRRNPCRDRRVQAAQRRARNYGPVARIDW